MARQRITRRSFLKGTGAAAAAAVAAPTIVPSSVLGKGTQVAPSNRIAVGMIGVGRQVIYINLKSFVEAPDV